MRVALFLVLFLTWYQELEAKEPKYILEILRNELLSLPRDRQKRSIVDLWNNVKNKANQAWESIRNIANSTKKKVADLIQNIKYKARELRKEFEEQLIEIKHRINDMIHNVINTGEIVKKCLQKRKESIDDILKNILMDVTNCISNSITNLDNIESDQHETVPNKTEFLKAIEEQLSICFIRSDTNDVEDCLHNVKLSIYENMDMTEEDILQNHVKTRSASNDILDTIICCTTDGMIKASSVIANETIQIIQCASQG